MRVRPTLEIILASARMRVLNISRYPGQLAFDVIIPIVFAAMPILLGRASGGPQVEAQFAANTGTTNYSAYMLIGSSAFTVVSYAFWHIAYWLRWEQETGTLESLYLTPTNRVWIAAGTALYSCLRALLTVSVAFVLGAWLLRIDPLQGDLGVALAFILVGLLPLYGIALLFGALVLKVKESNALVGLMQWAVTFLMGIFYPLAVFPPLLKFLALSFPPTWMTNGVRSALLGVGYFFGAWYADLAVLWVFLLVAPLFGYWVFSQVETSIRRNEGMGTF